MDNAIGYIWPNTHLGPIPGGLPRGPSPLTLCTYCDNRVCPTNSAFEIWAY